MKNLFITLVIICCWSMSTFAQSRALGNDEIKAAVMKISDHIKHKYVFEKKGNEIALHLMEKLNEGKFNSVKSWTEFAALSTEILQNYSNDGHLYVRHDAKTVGELSAATDVAPESAAEDPFFHSKEARERNFGFEEVKVIKGNIGYIKLSEINISEKSLATMFAAMEFVAHTRAPILDLRGNGGGGSEVGPVLESMFLPKHVKLLEFKSRGGEVTTAETVSWIQQKRYANPLFIIINKKTGSAAEALTFALQAKKRATVVGQPSAGAANMNSWYVVNSEVYVSVSTGAPTLPGTETSWETKGVQPDHTAAEGNEIEDVLRMIGQLNPNMR
jgi:hypothetical protein